MDELLNKKNQLMQELNIQYKNLVNFLVQVPVNQKFKEHGFQNLDQGMMWFQKGIEILEIDNKQENTTNEAVKNIDEKILDESVTIN